MPPVTELSETQRTLYDQIVDRLGDEALIPVLLPDRTLTGPFSLMVRSPHIGAHLFGLGDALRFDTTLTARQTEIAILTIASATGSAFEAHAHRLVARAVGFSDHEIEALLDRRWTSDDDAEQAVASVSLLICEQVTLTEDLIAEHASGLSAEALVDVIALASYYRGLAMMMGAFGITPPLHE